MYYVFNLCDSEGFKSFDLFEALQTVLKNQGYEWRELNSNEDPDEFIREEIEKGVFLSPALGEAIFVAIINPELKVYIKRQYTITLEEESLTQEEIEERYGPLTESGDENVASE